MTEDRVPTLAERIMRRLESGRRLDLSEAVYFMDEDVEAAIRAEQPAPPLDVERLLALLRDHCHDSADEGLPILLRHKHLAPFVRKDCAAAIARGLARLGSAPSRSEPE